MIGRFLSGRPTSSALSLACTALCAGMLACSGSFGEQIRRSTYPPDFNYIPAERLQWTMWQLASQVSQLDRVLRAETAPDEATQLVVIRLLMEMERSAAALGPDDWSSNHPRITQNLSRFRRELAAARRAVELDPPNFFLAGSASASCTLCHGAGSHLPSDAD